MAHPRGNTIEYSIPALCKVLPENDLFIVILLRATRLTFTKAKQLATPLENAITIDGTFKSAVIKLFYLNKKAFNSNDYVDDDLTNKIDAYVKHTWPNKKSGLTSGSQYSDQDRVELLIEAFKAAGGIDTVNEWMAHSKDESTVLETIKNVYTDKGHKKEWDTACTENTNIISKAGDNKINYRIAELCKELPGKDLFIIILLRATRLTHSQATNLAPVLEKAITDADAFKSAVIKLFFKNNVLINAFTAKGKEGKKYLTYVDDDLTRKINIFVNAVSRGTTSDLKLGGKHSDQSRVQAIIDAYESGHIDLECSPDENAVLKTIKNIFKKNDHKDKWNIACTGIIPDQLRDACPPTSSYEIDYVIDFQMLAHVCTLCRYTQGQANMFSKCMNNNGLHNRQVLTPADIGKKRHDVAEFLKNTTFKSPYIDKMKEKYKESIRGIVVKAEGGVVSGAINALDCLLGLNTLQEPITIPNGEDIGGSSITEASLLQACGPGPKLEIDHIIEFQMLAKVCRRSGYNSERAIEFSQRVNNDELHNLQVLTPTDNKKKRDAVTAFLKYRMSPYLPNMKEKYEKSIRGVVVRAEGESDAIKELDRLFANVNVVV